MKKLLIVFLVFIIFSCGDDFFEPKFDNERTLDQILADPERIEGFLIRAYQLLPNTPSAYNNNLFLDAATQNAVTNLVSNPINQTIENRWDKFANPLDNFAWANGYRAIQAVHNFLFYGIENDYVFWRGSSELDSTRNAVIRQRLEGEAYFLRGYFYFDLLRRFAGFDESGELMGVPLILEVQNVNEFDLLRRSSYLDVVSQIESDLNFAIDRLPAEYEPGAALEFGEELHYGRATSTACYVLLSRLHLYAGSPLFNSGSYDIPSLEKSVAAAAEVFAVKGTSLDNIYGGNGDDFYTFSEGDEIVLRRFGGQNNSIEGREFPPSFLGDGRTNPTQNLVDAFPLNNGYPIGDPNSGYNPQLPYQNRTDRFNATILYDGQPFKGSEIETFEGGKDVAGGSDAATVENSTRTGYYLRKWLGEEADLNNGTVVNHYFAIFRMGEVFLNYAEAALEAYGPNSDPEGIGLTPFQAIQEVRRRAGISNDEYLALSANDLFTLREIVRNERRLELCFEGHYFYDIRRWNSSLDVLNEPIRRIVIQAGTTKRYRVETLFTPQFESHMLYGPMPFAELLAVPTLTENQGW